MDRQRPSPSTASPASRRDSMDIQPLHRPLSHPRTDVGYCKWKDPSGKPLRGTPISGSPLGPLTNSPAPGLADAACSGGSGPCALSSSASASTSSCSPSAKVRVGGTGPGPSPDPRADAVPPLPAAWYSVLALLVLVPALLGYLQETCRARPSEPELVRSRYHSVRREDLRRVQLSRQEAIAQVKSFLIQLEGFLSGMCCSCEAAYRVLYWENPTVSSQFYGALLGSVCVLYVLPLCWVLAILNSTLFLGNTQFYQVIMELKASIEQCVGTKPLESTPEPAEPLPTAAPPDRTPTPTSTEDLTPGSVEEAEEAEPDEEFKDAIEEDDESSQCSADFDLSLPDNGFMSKNEVIRSKVSRLTERLRKRYPSNNFGSCTGCAATFSVLKKRRSCSNCGNSFCSRCCSFKVPKAVMGATAPEAQRETVFVCALCNQVLIK